MFGLIRLIFMLSIFGMGYSWFKWKTTGIARWRRHFQTLLNSTVVLAVVIAIVLIFTRLFR